MTCCRTAARSVSCFCAFTRAILDAISASCAYVILSRLLGLAIDFSIGHRLLIYRMRWLINRLAIPLEQFAEQSRTLWEDITISFSGNAQSTEPFTAAP